MKNLRKALAAVIALTVMSVSASAFAEISATGAFSGGNGAVTADYTNIASNTVVATVDTTLATTGTQMTFLVLDDGTDVTAINEGDILYIDQKELTAGGSGNSFTGVINLARVSGAAQDATELPEGSYPIRVGYYYDDNGVQTFGLAAATMVVEEASTGITVEFILGDVNGADGLTLMDATYIASTLAGGEPSVGGPYSIGQLVSDINGKSYTFGDVNGADGLTLMDATYIASTLAGGEPNVGATNGEGNAVAIGGTMTFVVAE